MRCCLVLCDTFVGILVILTPLCLLRFPCCFFLVFPIDKGWSTVIRITIIAAFAVLFVSFFCSWIIKIQLNYGIRGFLYSIFMVSNSTITVVAFAIMRLFLPLNLFVQIDIPLDRNHLLQNFKLSVYGFRQFIQLSV